MEENARTGELRRKLEKDPGSRLFAQLAEELRKDGKLDEAISVARSGLEKIPNYPSARLTLARALLDSGRPQEARPELEQIVKASPDNIMASRLLGEALESLGQLDQAMKQFEKTLVFAPGDKAVMERIAQLKAKRAAPLPPTVPPVPLAPPTVPPAARPPQASAAKGAPKSAADLFPSAFGKAPAAAPLPSVFGDAPTAAPLPSVFGDAPTAAPLPSVFGDAPAPTPALTAAPIPASTAAPAPAPPVALDRDLASGTFSPGSLNAADLQEHFEKTAAGEGATLPAVKDPDATLSLAQVKAEPAAAMPAEDQDQSSQTLPLNSVTLADLYLQQGLKAEASAVLSQVMKEEPENAQAKAKFAAVSSELAASAAPAAPPPTPAVPTPAPVAPSAAPVVPSPAPAVPAAAPVAPPPVPVVPSPAPVVAVAAPAAPAKAATPAPAAPAPVRKAPAPAPVAYRSARAKARDRKIAALRLFASAAEREAINQRATERGVI